jgi:hypothetical protein
MAAYCKETDACISDKVAGSVTASHQKANKAYSVPTEKNNGVNDFGSSSKLKPNLLSNRFLHEVIEASSQHSFQAKPTHWIEIDIRDAQNQPFIGFPVSIKDSSGHWHHQRLTQKGILITHLEKEGEIEIKVDADVWLAELKTRRACHHGWASPVADFARHTQGYKDKAKTYINTTCGDLFDNIEQLSLATHHHAGMADECVLHTDNSYVLELRGFFYRTLRIGVFFDGTANNGFHSMQSKTDIETWLEQCEYEPFRVSFSEQTKACAIGQLPTENSFANDETNIYKAYTLYDDNNSFPVIQTKVYIEGIGTYKNSESDSLFLGQALSLGTTSILAKVHSALHHEIPNIIDAALETYPHPTDAIEKIEFDVFGFSRGAAAARHLINRIDLKQMDSLIYRLTHQAKYPLIEGFDWSSKKYVHCHFAGLLDTVESAPFTKNQLMKVHSNQVNHLVHICAEDEYRYFFPLTGIAQNKGGEGLPDNFIEVFMPGSHADIGGGYYSRHMFENNADPCLTECKVIKSFSCIEQKLPTNYTKTSAYQKALSYAQNKLDEGWALDIYEDMHPSEIPKLNALSLCVQSRFIERRAYYEIKVDIYINRIIEGEYSRVPLHLLVAVAKNKNVPFKEIDPEDERFTLSTLRSQIPIKLHTLSEQWQQHIFTTGKAVHLHLSLDEATYRLLRYYYLHHSADESLVNKPNAISIVEKRNYIPNPLIIKTQT